MAYTHFGALSAAQKKVWAVELWKHGRDEIFWMANGFVSSSESDMGKPIQRITKLTETERGTECIMQLVRDLDTDGVSGDNMLEGNESPLYNDAIRIQIDQLRNGVKNRGKMAEQQTVIRFRSVAREKLSRWLADTIDQLMFLTISGRAYTLTTEGATRAGTALSTLTFAADVAAATSNRIMYAGSATSEGTLTVTDTMNWDLLVRSRARAARARLNPIRSKGKTYYAVVMSTEQAKDLKLDTDYQTNVGRAGVRGDDNPLFKGALAVVDGLILYEHQKVFSTLSTATKWGAGTNVDGAQALLLGAQALGMATLGTPEYEESDNTDYKNRQGIAYGQMFGLVKPQFQSFYDSGNPREDFGVFSIKTAAKL